MTAKTKGKKNGTKKGSGSKTPGMSAAGAGAAGLALGVGPSSTSIGAQPPSMSIGAQPPSLSIGAQPNTSIGASPGTSGSVASGGSSSAGGFLEPQPNPGPPDDPKIIREVDLELIMRKREQVKAAKAEVSKLEADLATHEKNVMIKLRGGAECEGRLVASIEVKTGQCRPPWKDIYVNHMVSEHQKAAEAVEEDARSRYPAGENESLAVGFKK